MANIKDKVTQIRRAIFGREVRESIASGIEEINKEVESTTKKQDLLETEFDQLVINAGNSNAEIVQARVDKDGGSYSSLKERLDKENQEVASKFEEVDSHLADKATKTDVANMGSASPKGTYATLTALQTAFPTGSTGIYVVTADGKWYYWNGSAWTVGGTYQSTGIADGSVKAEHIAQTYNPDLLDRTTVTNDMYTSNGTGYANVGSAYSDFIPVVAGKQYKGYFGDKNTGSLGAGVAGTYYKADKTVLNNIEAFATIEYTLTIPANVAFIKINLALNKSANWYFKAVENSKKQIGWLETDTNNYKDNSITKAKLSSDVIDSIGEASIKYTEFFYGKSSMYIGDSITAGIGVSDRYIYSYPVQLNTLLKINASQYLNYGVSGTTVTTVKGDGTSFVERVDGIPSSLNKDVCFIKGGTNDFVLNSPLDTLANAKAYKQANGEWNRAEFYGAYCNMVELIKSKNIAKRIILITPITEKNQNTANTQGKKLIDYVNAVLTIANEYDLPVVDMFNTLPIDATNAEHQTLYIPDGIHPNDAGYKLMAERIARFLTNEWSMQLVEYLKKRLAL